GGLHFQNSRFGEKLVVFAGCRRIDRDSAADSVFGGVVVTVQNDRPNGDVEHTVSAGTDDAHRAAIDAAWGPFMLGDELVRGDFRRTDHRAAWEQRREHVR